MERQSVDYHKTGRATKLCRCLKIIADAKKLLWQLQEYDNAVDTKQTLANT